MLFDVQLALEGKKRMYREEFVPGGGRAFRQEVIKITGSPIELTQKQYDEELERWLNDCGTEREAVKKAFERCYKLVGTKSKYDVTEKPAKLVKKRAAKHQIPTRLVDPAKPRAKKGEKNELKPKVFEILETLKDKGYSNSENAKIIAEKLSITYANAYYYCTRVFGK